MFTGTQPSKAQQKPLRMLQQQQQHKVLESNLVYNGVVLKHLHSSHVGSVLDGCLEWKPGFQGIGSSFQSHFIWVHSDDVTSITRLAGQSGQQNSDRSDNKKRVARNSSKAKVDGKGPIAL